MQPRPTTGLLSLPLELLHRILAYLPLSSIFQLGSTNRYLHRLIHQDDRLWRFKVRKGCSLMLWEDGLKRDEEETDDETTLLGLVHDPTLQGHKELFLLYSQEFSDFLRSHREQRRSKGDQIERMLRSFLPRLLPPKSSFLPDDGESTRLALFGPGIESPRTKLLVHKVVNSHTDVFDAVSFVGGLPGGFGSGVRINFRKLQAFDLMCLYTNSARAREARDPAERLATGTNKLLESGMDGEGDPRLHESLVRLLPTVQALLFAVDSASLAEASADNKEAILEQWQRELRLMVTGLGARARRHTPVLVLSCRWGSDGAADPAYLAARLGLEEDSGLPWAVYDVDIGDMEGMARALDWVLYHCQKRRNNLQYHKSQSEKLL